MEALGCLGEKEHRYLQSLPCCLAELEAYVATQRSLLSTLASSSPDRLARAGVNMERLLTQPQLDALFSEYGLQWRNIYWEASNGVSGVIAYHGPNRSLTAMEAELKAVGDLHPDGKVSGAYFFSVTDTPLATLAALDQEDGVLLVDIGPLDQADAAVAELIRLEVPPTVGCINFCDGLPLWHQQQKIATAGE